MVCVPGKCGIGVFGPSLDEKGNSLAGVRLLEEISKNFSLHIL
jgi:glutaminase